MLFAFGSIYVSRGPTTSQLALLSRQDESDQFGDNIR